MSHSAPKVSIHFVRHGQSEANLVSALICGQSRSTPLSPLGNQQAVLLGKRLKYQKMQYDYVLCSTAVRAKQTADIALKILGVDTSQMIVTDALLEQSQGLWEGKDRASSYSAEVLQQLADLHIEFSAPQGESMRMVQTRAVECLKPYLEEANAKSLAEHREVSIVVFTHANLIRAVLQYYLQSNQRHAWLIGQENTAITEIVFNQHGTSLVRVNDSAHLKFPIPEM